MTTPTQLIAVTFVEGDTSRTLGMQPDVDQDVFAISDIEGWGAATAKFDATERQNTGMRLDRFHYTQRELLIKGIAYTKSGTLGTMDVFRLRDKLERLATSTDTDLVVNERYLGRSRRAKKVVRNGEIEFNPPLGATQEFEIPLVALDPRKYNEAQTTLSVNGGPLSTTNNGTAPSYPVATLSAQVTNPWIERGFYNNSNVPYFVGDQIELEGTFPSGTIIDLGAKTVFVPGQGYKDVVVRPRNWWAVEPGANAIISGAPFSVTYRDAWW